MQSIGVIGGGVLGRAIARGFIEHAEIKVYDVVPERATHSLAEAATCDIVMIALPTPANRDGTCNTTAISEFLTEAQNKWWKDDSVYVIRSTVPIGYTRRQAAVSGFKLPIFHSPEFLTARCSLTDFQIPARNIIGNLAIEYELESTEPIWSITQTLSWKYGLREIEELYEQRFPGVPVHIMPSNASELVKLACNTFFASKVTLFNLFAEIAKAAGVKWEDVRGAILSDGRIAHAHTLVAEQPIGFGGACLAKDSADLFHCATALGVDAEIIRAVLDRNERLRRPYDPDLAKIALPPR